MDIRQVHRDENTIVVCSDRPGAGGACHKYQVVGTPSADSPDGVYARIGFQEGPIKENGINGCTNEDLLRVIKDRLEHFQAGPFPCEENQNALDAVIVALINLESRTKERKERGVEGQDIP